MVFLYAAAILFLGLAVYLSQQSYENLPKALFYLSFGAAVIALGCSLRIIYLKHKKNSWK